MASEMALRDAPDQKPSNGRASKSPTQLAIRRFMHNKLAVASMLVLALIVLACLGAPLLTHWGPVQLDFNNTMAPPSAQHILGTNGEGADYFAMDLYGGRVDLLIGLVGTVLILTIAIILGGLAGYYGGWVDNIIMRICDVMLNFPFLLLIIVISSILQHTNVWLLIAVISATGWPSVTRFVRGLFLSMRESEFVLGAKIAGAGTWRIILKHLLPNAIGPLIVNATFLVANLIGAEAALSIVGFGVQPPQPSWGDVLAGADDFITMQTQPWAWLPPALAISVTILCISFIGDGLRDAFDPSFEK